MSKDKSHKRRVANGLHALKRRRQQALFTLEKVAEPDERQQAEIEILQKRVGRG